MVQIRKQNLKLMGVLKFRSSNCCYKSEVLNLKNDVGVNTKEHDINDRFSNTKQKTRHFRVIARYVIG